MNILEQNRIQTNINYDDTIFMTKFEDYIKTLQEPMILSLSGGVDSMVILYIIKKILNKELIALHINYNNRTETDEEEEYLRNYCKELDVKFENIKLNIQRKDIKRSTYEKYTKNIRYSFYKEMIIKYKSNFIILGHHKDDQIENIFHNFMNSKKLFDLNAIHLFGYCNNINIYRPLIDFYKIEIYSIANKYSIPYFKDTTPNWSARGIFRKLIQPGLEQSYNNPKQNLLNVNNQLNEWSNVIDNLIINPIMESIIWNNDNNNNDNNNKKSIEFCFEKIVLQKQILWMEIIKRIYHEYSFNCPSNKSIYNLINNLYDGANICLTKNSIATINKFNIIINFN